MTRGLAPLPESIPVPDTDPVYSTVADMRTIGRALCKVTNSTDKAISITPEYSTSDDQEFAAGVEGTSQNIAASTTGFFTVTDPWSFVRVKIVAAEDPAPDGAVSLSWGYKHGGD